MIKMTFLCYAAMVRSIPAHIQNSRNAKKLVAPVLPYKIALLSRLTSTAQVVYVSLVKALAANGNTVVCKAKRKWERDIGQMRVGSLYDIRASTNNSYLQCLHYRIVKRIVATNTFLYRIGRADNPLCTFCGRENETLLHVLWNCDVVQRFIKDVQHSIRSNYNVSLDINVQKWFFPRADRERKVNILIITVAKHTILRSKYTNSPPNTTLFLALLQFEASKEKGAASRYETLNEFENKWGSIANILQR